MAKPKSKKSTQAGGSKKVQEKLIEGAGKISEKVAAKATAGKGKPARKTVQQDIAAKAPERGSEMAQQATGDVDKIADLVASRLGETNNHAQEAMGSVDKIADLVASRLGQTSDLVQETLAKQVDKIVDLIASRLDQTSNLTQQTLEKQVDKIAALVNTHTNTERSKVMSTLNLTGELNAQEGLDKLVEMVAAKLSQSTGGAVQQKAQPTPAADKKAQKFSTVPLNWKEVWYTNCPMVSASNIDQELGWTEEEFKKIGVKYAYMRSVRENDWYPHYIHNLDNLIRFGGLFPPIQVNADIRRTRLIGLTWVYEGGCMMVRSGDDIYRMADLKGKKIGISKSLNTIKNDWWRVQEEQGIELMLRINGMTRKDVQIVEFPYPDDWYSEPEMLEPLKNPSDLWVQRDIKRDMGFRPMEAPLEEGIIDAFYTQSKVIQHLAEATGKTKAIEDLSRYPDWTMQVCNQPTTATCTVEMAEKHPELVVAWLKGMIKVGSWANEHKHAASVILNRQTYYRDAEDTYQGIKDADIVPNLSPRNLKAVEIGKNFMLSHGYIKSDFDVNEWAAPEFLEKAAQELIEERWKTVTSEKLSEASDLYVSSRRIG